jgi:MFS family permease
MVGGVISDIYHAEDRNTPMALFAGAALFGTGLAPMVAGAIVTHSTWRWIYYSHAIVSAAFVVIIFFFFKETRGSVLLSRKAHKLNAYYEQLEEAGHIGVLMSSEESGEEKSTRRIRWKVKSDEQRASLVSMIQISLYRPFRKLCRIIHALEYITNFYRHALHRARGFLFLCVGILQLGYSLPPVRLRASCL